VTNQGRDRISYRGQAEEEVAISSTDSSLMASRFRFKPKAFRERPRMGG
jgi:hypothetical protein